MPTWDADLYRRFATERTQPAIDLAARIGVENPRRVADLGCGPGNSTAVLRHRWPDADVIGLDSSPEMIAAAQKAEPAGTWQVADIAHWSPPEPFDVVFTNAALQWLPDHRALLPRLVRHVAPGGAFAMQIPVHLESPVHRLMVAIADRPEWRDRTAGARGAIVAEGPAFYYDALQPHARHIDLWVTEYCHVLDGPTAIVEWIRGTGLRPFLEALADDAERKRFETLLLDGVTAAYPRRVGGKVLFPFRRLFAVASP
ncbi:MAG: methyltransferase domain-containing protein [Gemmataceae bacterium]